MYGIEGIDELKDESGDEWKPDNPRGEVRDETGLLTEEEIRRRMVDAASDNPSGTVEMFEIEPSDVKAVDDELEQFAKEATENYESLEVKVVDIADVSDEAGVRHQAEQSPFDVEALLRDVIVEEVFENGDPQLERIADMVHQVWANWMNYMFSKGLILRDKGFKINPAEHGRWRRQAKTPYAELSEDEKQSDRDIARRYLDVMADYFLEDPHV